MDKEKQIEEMARDIKAAHDEQKYITSNKSIKAIAEHLYNAGYRKASDVAREIFEEIEREINDALQSNYKVLPLIEQSEALWNRENGKIDALRGIEGYIAELKNKYTESENDNGKI